VKTHVCAATAVFALALASIGAAEANPRGRVHVNTHHTVNRNVNVNRNVHVHGAARPVGYHGAWVRPYRWAPGGAIAAGAAIGFVTAASAAAWAGPPPQPGLCWYYTDPSQRAGFWDACP